MRKIVVTGGSRGLGLTLCRRLLSEECYVVTCSRSRSPALEDLIAERPSRIEHHVADFSDPASVRAFSKLAGLGEGVDGFVSNAAVGESGLLTLTSEEAILKCLQTNLTAPVILARDAVKGMLGRGGSIVFVSSVAATRGISGLAAYSAAKGGLHSLSRSLAREYGPKGIRSNVVAPGFFESEMSADLEMAARLSVRRRTPLQRFATAEEVASTICFLLSDRAASVTGIEMLVDGGFSC